MSRTTPDTPFRFYDNRQKYLQFVTTTNEKWKVAERAAKELSGLKPEPPALRLFDAGVGDGTVLAHLMRAMHQQFPTIPFYIVGKEISLEDVRLTLEKLGDRFIEHPQTVFVITSEGTVRPASVKSGVGVGQWVVVEGPVGPGDRVVTRGNERLFPGQPVSGEPLEYPLP